jgi:hypothetical protein
MFPAGATETAGAAADAEADGALAAVVDGVADGVVAGSFFLSSQPDKVTRATRTNGM